jgi:hypothetical protein
MFNVHVRINDAATGQPTPVRLRISGSDGRVYAPLCHVAEFATGRNEDVGGHVMLGRDRWYYIDGACEVPLPGGVPLVVEVGKGPEYRPLRHETTLGVGQMALRLTIKRWIELRAEGWYSGDTRCHFLSPHAALLEAQAEDLAVTQLLATETNIAGRDGRPHTSMPNIVAFSGQQPCLEQPGHVVAVNTLNSHPVLGSLALLHCHRAVFPLSFGGADATDDWSLADWCDQCHRKKGLVVWADAFQGDAPIAPEALADLVLGRIDAVEAKPGQANVREWYRAWSAGICFPLVGASSKDCNRVALGTMRTFARLNPGEAFGLPEWIEAVRAGRTVATSGPLLRFSVDGRDPGAVIDHPGGQQVISIKARLESAAPIAFPLEIVRSGEVLVRIRATPDDNGVHVATVEFDQPISEPSWLAARCAGPATDSAFAHSSPVFVRVGGKMPSDAAVARQYADSLARTVDWVDTVGRFDVPRRKEQLRALLEQARQELLTRAAGG